MKTPEHITENVTPFSSEHQNNVTPFSSVSAAGFEQANFS